MQREKWLFVFFTNIKKTKHLFLFKRNRLSDGAEFVIP